MTLRLYRVGPNSIWPNFLGRLGRIISPRVGTTSLGKRGNRQNGRHFVRTALPWLGRCAVQSVQLFVIKYICIFGPGDCRIILHHVFIFCPFFVQFEYIFLLVVNFCNLLYFNHIPSCTLVLITYLSFVQKENYQQQVAIVAMALKGGGTLTEMTKNQHLFTLLKFTTDISELRSLGITNTVTGNIRCKLLLFCPLLCRYMFSCKCTNLLKLNLMLCDPLCLRSIHLCYLGILCYEKLIFFF